MLWLERQVVRAMVAERDRPRRQAVEAFVDGALGSMPEHLRLGVAAESVILGAGMGVNRALRRVDGPMIDAKLNRWSVSHLGPVRQYVRLLRSLVLFADNEIEPGAGG